MAIKVTRHDVPSRGSHVDTTDLDPPDSGYSYVDHSIAPDGGLVVVWEHDGGQPDVEDRLEDLTEAVGDLKVVVKDGGSSADTVK